ncbi:aminotransferase class I/II-fold pyridoxal phosphate-dependent enzyme [Nocardia brasiliensis]|uniref:cysteine-S-conjugate beta-lyase n=1 Tax=Nocardia brasiliensis TaxID=37326 RepID=A0A6G9XSM5_NOCBR|nr:aminotransferase class I/II-fold pyridoxal phosphate-dependent enzyme [Nocardia brasiliensis]QIS03860.1 aminotransferase class I/II-fold pyridoxal phosphate-dependent enzyme [Nocardia brasiliensis]
MDLVELGDLRRRAGVKWARAGTDVLPGWIADMDFPVPDAVRAVLQRAAIGDLGYPAWDERPELNPLPHSFAARMRERHGFEVDPAQVHVFTELIQVVQIVLQLTTRPGDAVAVHTPTYPPFLETLRVMGRRLVPIQLVETADGWGFDAERMAAQVRASDCRALIMVNPNNPTGHVFDRAELTAIAEIACRHDLVVIADEIHSELTHDPHRHLPIGALGPEIAARTVTLNSASKAFNLAGLRCCVAHVGDRRVREALAAQPPKLYGQVSAPSVLATEAAWQEGDAWLAATRQVLTTNRDLVADALPPWVRYHRPQASYLAWLDCRALELDQDPAAFFLDEAKVMVLSGPDFGPGGSGFARLNFATYGPVLTEMLARMREAVEKRLTR